MRQGQHQKLAIHILPSAATMVGVCLTAIGLAKLVEQHNGPSHIDVFLACDSVLFCISMVLSYGSIRFEGLRRARRYEMIADYVFTAGMVSMVVICMLFALDIG